MPKAKVLSFQRVLGLHGNVAVTEVPFPTGPRRQSLLPNTGHKDQNSRGGGCSRTQLWTQAVVERPAPQGKALARHTEAAAVVERDGGVEASPAVEFDAGPEPVDARGHQGSKSVDAGHRFHPADEQLSLWTGS